MNKRERLGMLANATTPEPTSEVRARMLESIRREMVPGTSESSRAPNGAIRGANVSPDLLPRRSGRSGGPALPGPGSAGTVARQVL